MFLKLHTWLFILAMTLFMTACSSIPITSLYKLYKLDPFTVDPQQFRIIVRAHEAISIRKGNVTMKLGFKADDDSLTIDDTYLVEIERNGSLPLDVVDDKKPEEALTLFRLSYADAQQLAETQKLLQPYVKEKEETGDSSGKGSFSISISGVCLNGALPPGKSLVTLYLQSDVEKGFFVFIKNLDIRKNVDNGLDDISSCID